MASRRRKEALLSQARGYMQKLGGFIRNWKARYFVIDNFGQLQYFESPDDVNYGDPKGSIPIQGAHLRRVSSEKYKKPFLLSLQPRGENRTYILSAPNAEMYKIWLEALRVCGAMDVDTSTDPTTGASAKMDSSSVLEGWLLKVSGAFGSVVTSWQKRYCVLTKRELSWYLEKDRSSKPRNCVPLVGACLKIEPYSTFDKKYVFSIRPLSVNKSYYLATGSDKNLHLWVRALETHIGKKAAREDNECKSEVRTRRGSDIEKRRGSHSDKLVPVVGSNKGIVFTDGKMKEGCQVWTDKACVFKSIPRTMQLGHVIRFPMKLSNGTVLTFQLRESSVAFALFPDPDRKGRLSYKLAKAGWAEMSTENNSIPEIVNGSFPVIKCMWAMLPKGKHQFPKTEGRDTVVSLILVRETDYNAESSKKDQTSKASKHRSRSPGKRENADRGVREEERSENLKTRVKRSTSTGTSDKKKRRSTHGKAESENRGSSKSLKAMLIEAANGDEEKWIQIRNLSVMLKKEQIAPDEYLLQFLMMYGSDTGLELFPHVLQAAPNSETRKAMKEAFENYKKARQQDTEKGKHSNEKVIKEQKKKDINVSEGPSTSSETNQPKPEDDLGDEEPAGEMDLRQRIMRRIASLDNRKEKDKKTESEREAQEATMTAHVKDWLKRHRRDIVELLVNLDEIFPEGFDKDPFKLGEKKSKSGPDPSKVRSAYKKALLKIHPDKVRDLSVPQIVRAEIVYEGISKSYKKYLKRLPKGQ